MTAITECNDCSLAYGQVYRAVLVVRRFIVDVATTGSSPSRILRTSTMVIQRDATRLRGSRYLKFSRSLWHDTQYRQISRLETGSKFVFLHQVELYFTLRICNNYYSLYTLVSFLKKGQVIHSKIRPQEHLQKGPDWHCRTIDLVIRNHQRSTDTNHLTPDSYKYGTAAIVNGSLPNRWHQQVPIDLTCPEFSSHIFLNYSEFL